MQLPQTEAEEQLVQQLDASEQKWIEHLSYHMLHIHGQGFCAVCAVIEANNEANFNAEEPFALFTVLQITQELLFW